MTIKASLLTINQAAELVDGLSPFRLRQMCIKGELPHIRAGNKYLINKNRLLELIGENAGGSKQIEGGSVCQD